MVLSLVQGLFITGQRSRLKIPAATRLSSSKSSCGECARFRGSRRALPAFAMFPLSFSNALVSNKLKDRIMRMKAHENGPNDM